MAEKELSDSEIAKTLDPFKGLEKMFSEAVAGVHLYLQVRRALPGLRKEREDIYAEIAKETGKLSEHVQKCNEAKAGADKDLDDYRLECEKKKEQAQKDTEEHIFSLKRQIDDWETKVGQASQTADKAKHDAAIIVRQMNDKIKEAEDTLKSREKEYNALVGAIDTLRARHALE